MSYGIMPYRVKLAKIESCFGLGDPVLQADILQKSARKVARLDDWFDDGAPMKEILADFFAGKASHPNAGYKYWYAIEMIVSYFGQMLNNGAWYPADIDALWKIPELRMYLLSTTPRIPSPDDFPTVFMVEHATLDEALLHLQEKITDVDQVAEFTEWCRAAKASGEDLVLYYY